MCSRFDVYSRAPKTRHTSLKKKDSLLYKTYRDEQKLGISGMVQFLAIPYSCHIPLDGCKYLNAAAEIHTNILGCIDALTFAPNKKPQDPCYSSGV